MAILMKYPARWFLAPLLLAGFAMTPAPCTAIDKVPVIVGNLSFPGDPFDQYWRRFENKMRAQQIPDLEAKLFIRGELGSEEILMRSLRRGRVQMGSFTASGISAVIPEFGVLLAPYLFDSLEQIHYVIDHHLTPIVEALCAEAGLELLAWNDEGWFNLYAKRSIRVPEDARNYRMRALQAAASRAFLGSIGADVIVIPFPEVITSLQTGLISGGETGSMIYHAAELYREASHLILTRHAYSAGLTVANKAWFARQNQTHQQAIRRAVPAPEFIRQLLRRWEIDDLARIRKAGGDVYEPSPNEIEQWRAASRANHEVLVAEAGGRARELYTAIIEGKHAYRRQPSSE